MAAKQVVSIEVDVEVVGQKSIAELEARLKKIKKDLAFPSGTSQQRKELARESRFLKENLFELNQEQKNLTKSTKASGTQLNKFSKTTGGARQGIQGMAESMRVFLSGSDEARIGISALEDGLISGANVWAAVAAVVILAAFALFKYLQQENIAEKIIKNNNKIREDAAVILSKQTTELLLLTEVAKDETQSLDDRKEALRRINAITPDYIKDLTLMNINTEEGTDILDDYIVSLKKAALAQAELNRLQELSKELVIKQSSSLEDNITWYEKLFVALENSRDQGGSLDLQTAISIRNKEEDIKVTQDQIDALGDKFKADVKSGKITLKEAKRRDEEFKKLEAKKKKDKLDAEREDKRIDREKKKRARDAASAERKRIAQARIDRQSLNEIQVVDEGEIEDPIKRLEAVQKSERALAKFRADARGRERIALKESFDTLILDFKLDFETRMQLAIEQDAALEAFDKESKRKAEDRREKEAKKEIELEFQKAQARMAIRANLVGGFAKLIDSFNDDQEKKSRAAFEISKGLAAAEATVSTIAGAQNVFKTTSALLPPPFPTIAAIGALAAGFANVKKILSTKIGGTPSATIGGTGLNATQLQPQQTGFTDLTRQQVDVTISKPIKAFVVESDLRDVSGRVQDIIDVSTII